MESFSPWTCALGEMHTAFSLAIVPSRGPMFLADTTPAFWGVWHLKKALSFSRFHILSSSLPP